MSPATWTVIACGERERGDDGAALEAALRLADDACGDEDADDCGLRIRLVGQLSPEELVDGLDEGRVLVLDAVRGVEPGSVVELPLSALVDRPPGWSATTHVLPIASVVRLAAALGAGLDRGWFVGLGGERFELGSGLSAPVRAALPRYVAHVERRLYGAEVAGEDSRT